jgi:hypothetical protein
MGFEAIASTADSARNQRVSEVGPANASVAVFPPVPADADLAEVIAGWPALPKPVRIGILSLVRGVLSE